MVRINTKARSKLTKIGYNLLSHFKQTDKWSEGQLQRSKVNRDDNKNSINAFVSEPIDEQT